MSMQIAMRQTMEGSKGDRPVSFGDQIYLMSTERRTRPSSTRNKNLFSNDTDQNKNNNAIEQNKVSDKGSNHEQYEMIEGDEAPMKRMSKAHYDKPIKRKRQAFRDNLILGPIDKYVKYNIFPWKFIVHLMLMLLTAWLVLLQVRPQTAYEAQIQMTINQLFLTKDYTTYDPPEIGGSVTLYSIDELRDYA